MTRETAQTAIRRWEDWWANAKRPAPRETLGDVISIGGESVLYLNSIPDTMRKKMLKSVEQGFTIANSGLWPDMLDFIVEHGPVPRITPLGYIGSTRLLMWVAEEDAKEALEEIRTLVSLTGKFPTDCIDYSRYRKKPGYKCVEAHASYWSYNSEAARKAAYAFWDKPENREHREPQLRKCFSEVRHYCINKGKETFEQRRPLYDFIAEAKGTVTVPFYTGPGDGKTPRGAYYSGY